MIFCRLDCLPWLDFPSYQREFQHSYSYVERTNSKLLIFPENSSICTTLQREMTELRSYLGFSSITHVFNQTHGEEFSYFLKFGKYYDLIFSISNSVCMSYHNDTKAT